MKNNNFNKGSRARKSLLVLILMSIIFLVGINKSYGHTENLYYKYNANNTITFYAGTYHNGPFPVGGIILGNVTHLFTGTVQILPFSCLVTHFVCTNQQVPPTWIWQTVTIPCQSGTFSVSFTTTTIIESPDPSCGVPIPNLTLTCNSVPILSANPPTICKGQWNCTTLTASPAANGLNQYTWYTGNNCSGPPIDFGNTISVCPSVTTTYSARLFGPCITSADCGFITVTVCPPITFTTSLTYQSVCKSCLTINASGGCGPFTYSINGGSSFQSSNVFCPLASGTYAVVVKNSAGCISAVKNVKVSPPAMTLDFAIDNHASPCCPILTVTGGVRKHNFPYYDFVWSNGSIGPNLLCPPQLSDGKYDVTVTDSIGCMATGSVTVNCHACVDTCHYWAVGGNNKNNGGKVDETNNTENILGINDVGNDGAPAPVGPQINLSPLRIFTNSTERMRILSTGQVGVNTGTPGPNLGTQVHVKGVYNGVLSQINCAYTTPGGLLLPYAIKGEVINTGFGCGGWAGYFQGNVKIAGKGWINQAWIVSDSRLKENIDNVSNALTTIRQLQPKTYNFRINDYPYLNLPQTNQIGFIAQDIQSVLPDLVDSSNYDEVMDSSGNVVYDGGTFLGLNYDALIPLAIKGIIELDSIRNISGVSTSSPLDSNYLPKATGSGTLCNSQIYDNGFCVGIGTDTVPLGYKCVVEGKFGARDIIVACPPSWPDYVFDATHLLKPLDDLENYVTANKHLPGIPSANEIEKSGINVGEMQTKQMEKIEELYQYIIQMNKNVQRLSAENKQLKERMKNMENK